MSNPHKKVKQHLASIRTSVTNVEARLIELFDMYSPDEPDVERFFKSIFDDTNSDNFQGRRKYIQLLTLMKYYNNLFKDVLDEYDVIV